MTGRRGKIRLFGPAVRRSAIVVALLLVVPMVASAVVYGPNGVHWSEANYEPTGQAPDPAKTPEAVVQVYAARAFGWRGAVGVHTWIALKPQGAADYTRLEVIGWGVRRGRSAVRRSTGSPDNHWAGSRPWILVEHRGPAAARMIADILTAAKDYPFPDSYRVWPGPNSNSFTAFVARRVPALRLELPPLAVGKDFLATGGLVGPAPSGTGYQLSLFGLAGLLVAIDEGLEVHLMGLTLGIDPKDIAIKLPGLGSVSPLGIGR